MKYYFILLLFLFGCNSNELINPKISYYSNGKVKAIKYFKDNLLNGECYWFFSNGVLDQKITYLNGKVDGHVYFFYQSGALHAHKFFKNDKAYGFGADYFDTTIGIIKNILEFNDSGQLIYRKEFSISGKIIKEEGKKF